MKRGPRCTTFLLLICGLVVAITQNRLRADSGDRKSRNFLFTYAATVEELPRGKTARIWLPMASSNDEQQIRVEGKKVPAEERIGRETKYGNQILFLEAKPDESGKISLSVTYLVTRQEVKGESQHAQSQGENPEDFLKPDAKVPISGKPLELIQGKEIPADQTAAARLIYDIVNGHMRYEKKGSGWGQGDSIWACEHGYGNCTDFHSLFISLARSQGIPAKFEIGFPLPDKHGTGDILGYHCWAKFRPAGKNWIAVDISEANKNPKLREYYFGNLTENRIAFSSGRDLELVPRQEGPPLNFFVYPYVEVDGKQYDKITKKFSFKDLDR
jgi:transglutaminase-like putative cysteine protease